MQERLPGEAQCALQENANEDSSVTRIMRQTFLDRTFLDRTILDRTMAEQKFDEDVFIVALGRARR
jgi:hypothetical protein